MTTWKGSIDSTDGLTAINVTVVSGDAGPVIKPLVIPKGTNTVAVVGKELQFPLAYVDPGERNAYPAERGPNELGAYTATWGVRTGTNKVGWEVQLDYTGMVIGSGVSVIIPTNGAVLSGHDTGASDGAAAFLKKLSIGDKIDFKMAVVPPGPIEPPKSRAFPDWVVSSYWQQYQGPDLETALRTMPGYNTVFAAFAIGNGGQNMVFSPRSFTAYSGTNGESLFGIHIKEWQQLNKVVGISIGGGVGAASATVMHGDAQGLAVYNSLAPIIDKYGFTAVDDDLENGPGGFDLAGLRGLYSRLRKTYGPAFGLCMTPRPYEDFHLAMGKALYEEGLLDLLQLQFYDAPETKDPAFLKTWIPGRVAATGVPASIVVPGSITWSGYNAGWNTVDNYLASTLPIKGIRGLMNWELSLDVKMGGTFASKVAAAKPVA